VTTLIGLHHLGLTVTDVDRSTRWYRDVLGFAKVGELGGPGQQRRKVFLRHPGFPVRLGLVEHQAGSRGAFDETTTGLDHLAFTVRDARELEHWARRLEQLGVPFSPAAAALSIPGGLVIVFRDPDNIQLELFAEPLR
jgi:catechol 2,3-dioxygenase-like lactoylglutathione lyase family enzyme